MLSMSESAETEAAREYHAMCTDLHSMSLKKTAALRSSQKKLVDAAMVKLNDRMNNELLNATEIQKQFSFFREEVEMLGDPEEWLQFTKERLTSICNELRHVDAQLEAASRNATGASQQPDHSA
jgi:hypothetical protein